MFVNVYLIRDAFTWLVAYYGQCALLDQCVQISEATLGIHTVANIASRKSREFISLIGAIHRNRVVA